MKILLFLAALAAGSATAGLAFAELDPPKEVKDAAFGLAVAAHCREKYGEDDLFEAAFKEFEAMVREHGGLSRAEVLETRQHILDAEIDIEKDDPIGRMFCDNLRAHLM